MRRSENHFRKTAATVRGALKAVATIAAVAVLAACASMGRPEGGAKDELPPVFVRSNPMPGTLEFKGSRVEVFFDENVKLDDAQNKVVVSPIPLQQPSVSANGRRVVVEFRDTLEPNTTYTIDFSDAIRDLNEGNILESYATDFSTGTTRDTLAIAGMVLEARNLEPAQGMLVGVHSDAADSALMLNRFDRIAKTDQYGRFIVRNLPAGSYRIYAINDVNRDYKWDRSEDVAFLNEVLTPRAEAMEVTDTLRSSAGTDSIVNRPGVRLLPNDVLLTWFNENYASQYLKNYTRPDSTRLVIELGAPSDTFPEITMLDGPAAGSRLRDVSVLQYNSRRDTLTYWLRDSRMVAADTMRFAMHYLRTDTLNNLSWTDDTLRIVYKRPAPKKPKKQKTQPDSIATDSTVVKVPTFKITSPTRGSQELNRPLVLEMPAPVERMNAEGMHISQLVDTVWFDLPAPAFTMDSINNPLLYYYNHKWQEGTKYKLTVDSAAVTNIYGIGNEPLSMEFLTKSSEDYSTVQLALTLPEGIDKPVVVELLSTSDKPVASQTLGPDNTVKFEYLAPATYYVRAFIDANGNGTWDTGNVMNHVYPEDTYYYDKKINVRKNWDVQQNWQVDNLPVDKQKPLEIVKNKPKLKESAPVASDPDEEEDDFYTPGYNSVTGSGSHRSGNSGNSRLTSPGNLSGLRQ